MLRGLAEVPLDQPVALLLRHSVRDALPAGDAGNSVPITEVGEKLGRELGRVIGQRLRSLYTSPLLRCVQTAEALRAGAAVDLRITADRLLGDPGVYVVDGRRAWTNWEALGHQGVMAHLVASHESLPGMARPDTAARFLVQHMLVRMGSQPGLHVFVTHDSLVTATAAQLLGQALGKPDWPWYLEGALFWRSQDGLHTAYRDHHQVDARSALGALAFEIAERVVELPIKIEPPTLHERLARFDLALSAVGVAYQPGDRWSAAIHPLARRSVQQRQVLLLKPLVNWKYALTTLARMRRYAAELGFESPASEEEEVWRVFDAQSQDMRAEMLDLYAQTEAGDPHIVKEASLRRG